MNPTFNLWEEKCYFILQRSNSCQPLFVVVNDVRRFDFLNRPECFHVALISHCEPLSLWDCVKTELNHNVKTRAPDLRSACASLLSVTSFDFPWRGKPSMIWSDTLFCDFCCLFSLRVIRRLLGIITKKDILKHMAQIANRDPDSILFNWAPPSFLFAVLLCRPGDMKTPACTLKWTKCTFTSSTLKGCSGRSSRAPFAQASEQWNFFFFL